LTVMYSGGGSETNSKSGEIWRKKSLEKKRLADGSCLTTKKKNSKKKATVKKVLKCGRRKN